MAPNGPPDEFHNQRTQYRSYGGPSPAGGPPPNALPAEPPTDFGRAPEGPDPFDEETEPTPWYRRPVGIIAWVVAVLVLIALIVYGLMELIQGDQGAGHTPSTSTTAPSTTSTTTPPTTTSTAPPTTTEPPPSSASEPPAQQPPQQQPTRRPTQQQPTHRHHLPPLPSVITIPEVPTVITLPPGLS